MPSRFDASLVRRVALVICSALVIVAIVQYFTVQVSETPAGEMINGRADTASLAVPFVLFVVGLSGLLAALSWRPGRR